LPATWTKAVNFSDIEDLIADQGDIAIVIDELVDVVVLVHYITVTATRYGAQSTAIVKGN
jgi:ribosomal protein L18E